MSVRSSFSCTQFKMSQQAEDFPEKSKRDSSWFVCSVYYSYLSHTHNWLCSVNTGVRAVVWITPHSLFCPMPVFFLSLFHDLLFLSEAEVHSRPLCHPHDQLQPHLAWKYSYHLFLPVLRHSGRFDLCFTDGKHVALLRARRFKRRSGVHGKDAQPVWIQNGCLIRAQV